MTFSKLDPLSLPRLTHVLDNEVSHNRQDIARMKLPQDRPPQTEFGMTAMLRPQPWHVLIFITNVFKMLSFVMQTGQVLRKEKMAEIFIARFIWIDASEIVPMKAPIHSQLAKDFHTKLCKNRG
ncbi:hypothetical protein [Sodalinema gerasimenkoae]|uniref:hypothetical protein n=1 Tax=Sodalinema gerasimenkoae TaxID=2862348 RepID=UPI00135ABCA8|nr:hypothetical protein [Sodalinema gerasimenkoae]